MIHCAGSVPPRCRVIAATPMFTVMRLSGIGRIGVYAHPS